MLRNDSPQPLPVLALEPRPLDARQTREVRNLMADQIWLDTRRGRTLEAALDRLAPSFDRRRGPGRRARTARLVAWEVGDAALVVVGVLVTAAAAVVLGPLALITLGPFLYELGV